MPTAVRKVNNKVFWAPERMPHEAWLAQDEARADALPDLKTKDNRLSIYILDDDSQDALVRVLAALAASCDHLNKLDYITFDAGIIAQLGLETDNVVGTTLDAAVNVLHRDIIHLTAGRLAAFANALQAQGIVARKAYAAVRDLIQGAIDARHILHEDLPAGLQAKTQRPRDE